MHPFIHILGKEIPMYSICIMTGMLVAGGVIALLSKKFSVKRDDALYSYIYAILVMVAGAKILYILVNIPNLPEMIEEVGFTGLMQGGFVVYGGILGAFLGVAIYGWQFKLDPKPLYSVLIVGLPLAQAFGRIGCFMAGCCYGKVSFGRGCFYMHGAPRFPVQLMASGLDLLLFFILLASCMFKKTRGYQLSLYMIGYGIVRFICELFRGDVERGFVGPLSVSQWFSIVFFCVGIVLFVVRFKKVEEVKVPEEKQG
ncbi:MAG: prolipoprotein diacylglyceryl transferase [Treponema sp.]|nr:prolipoprotein diacylglyceryl transferase [Treponema sp.]